VAPRRTVGHTGAAREHAPAVAPRRDADACVLRMRACARSTMVSKKRPAGHTVVTGRRSEGAVGGAVHRRAVDLPPEFQKGEKKKLVAFARPIIDYFCERRQR
jgi:hypothetical protein